MQYHPIWQFVEKDHLVGKDEEVYKEKSCFNDMSQKKGAKEVKIPQKV